MSTFVYEGTDRIYFGAQATLLDTSRETASEWAADHIVLNEAHSWIVGKFVEAEKANKNQQYFTLGDLQMSNPTIAHAPMNINHNARDVVGAFVASELVYPKEQAGEGPQNPFIESLAVLWKYYFPEQYQRIQQASAGGSLFYSMECVPLALSTVGGTDDTKVFPYEGRQSPNYSSEINDRKVPMKLHNPHFVGGALVIPPAKPAWDEADARQISNLLNDNWKQAEMAYASIKEATPDMESSTWETLMNELLLMDGRAELARTFNADARKKAVKDGASMSDGSFPIYNQGDLNNAVRLVGQAKNPQKAKAHIMARAKTLGLSLPDSWKS